MYLIRIMRIMRTENKTARCHKKRRFPLMCGEEL